MGDQSTDWSLFVCGTIVYLLLSMPVGVFMRSIIHRALLGLFLPFLMLDLSTLPVRAVIFQEDSPIQITPTDGLMTAETQMEAEFTIRLSVEPTANVVISLETSDPSEGVVEPSEVVFTPRNWRQRMVLTVIGVDDNQLDGDVTYVVTASAESNDTHFSGLELPVIHLTNRDFEVSNPVVNDQGDGAEAYLYDGLCDANAAVEGSQCTLRAAIENANAHPDASSITFAADSVTETWTIYLDSDLPNITAPLTIAGLSADRVSINGRNSYQIFNIENTTAEMTDIRLVEGNSIYGGAIYNSGMLTLSNMVISVNQGSDGGAIRNLGQLTVIETTFSKNVAGNVGGAIYSTGMLNIQRSSFIENEALSVGGGIVNEGVLNIDNSTFSGNSTLNRGGALYNFSPNTVIINTTFALNGARLGASIFHQRPGSIHVYNSLFVSPYSLSCAGQTDLIRGQYNLATDDSCGEDFTLTSEDKIALDEIIAMNGGQTAIHALLPGSVAINAGSNELLDMNQNEDVTDDFPYDQRGITFPRIREGNVDIGAFESAGDVALLRLQMPMLQSSKTQ
jgi:predicted outer membrane repeat protein